LKPWTDQIQQHVKDWCQKLGSDPARRWWPKYVYHFTDVQNAARILGSGVLLSRERALSQNLMASDNACASVIARTEQARLQFVRLYFRPRTPTQYRNEGIRPEARRWRPDGGSPAHCPVPVFFCFDAVPVLSADATQFSTGSLAHDECEFGDSRDLFQRIPFEMVFHQGGYPPELRASYNFRRHAEVLVPHQLPLAGNLRVVVCRSTAERQTLLQLLPSGTREQREGDVRLGFEGLFERKWTFVESVSVIDEGLAFQFNPNSQCPGPFQLRFVYREDGQLHDQTWEGEWDTRKPFRIRLKTAYEGVARLYLDGCLAFCGHMQVHSVPF
jgi:hypothetical protein